MIRGQEWLIVLLIVLLIFGARKLPDLARSLGSSAKEFRKGIEEGNKEDAEPAAEASDQQTNTSEASGQPDSSKTSDS